MTVLFGPVENMHISCLAELVIFSLTFETYNNWAQFNTSISKHVHVTFLSNSFSSIIKITCYVCDIVSVSA